ncbi:MAG: aminotransferase class III-fold pyridoxal phosphate-dependent enzyme [Gammaproteobacteria bacterium]|nr:aminotransferase class III-fold pyridoxal phosphate-dependent enzyme [Gammaproteobacteria bacterium]
MTAPNSTLTQPPPAFDGDRAREIAKSLYGIDGAARSLASERDQNFLIEAPGGRFVLKIANSAEPLRSLELQNAALLHLAHHASELGMPRVCRTPDRQDIVCVREARGVEHAVRVLTYLDGDVLAEVPHTEALLQDLGSFLGRVTRALQGFGHAAAHRDLLWDLRDAQRIESYLGCVADQELRGLVAHFIGRYRHVVLAKYDMLPAQVIHNDANDHNVLVTDGRVSGLIDFGDMLFAPRVCELAVAMAYALMNKADPLSAARDVVAGFNREIGLGDDELAVLYDLVAMRLCLSVCIAAWRSGDNPDNDYLRVSQQGVRRLLTQWRVIHPQIALGAFRAACGREPMPNTRAVAAHLDALNGDFAPVLGFDLASATKLVLRFSEGSDDLDEARTHASTAEYSQALEKRLATVGARVGIGLYGEARGVYTGDDFADGEAEGERRRVHLGIDLFAPADTPVRAPLGGRVFSVQNNAARLDYGPTVILQHRTVGGEVFYTLYGHLSLATLEHVQAGQDVAAGDCVGWVGTYPHNGDWAPHLHLQLMVDNLDMHGTFPGVAAASQLDVWKSVCPDPNVLLGIPCEAFAQDQRGVQELLAERAEVIGPSLSVSYTKPLKIVRGRGVHLYASDGRRYLDTVNNISHVGHCHPSVVAALHDQAQQLNTNTRYLHESIVDYAKRVTELLPAPLRVCYFVCSGSEANELALRIAHTVTGNRDLLCLQAAYHGNTAALIDVSPYKYAGRGGEGRKPHVHELPLPDVYRGIVRSDDPDPGAAYAAYAEAELQVMHKAGLSPAALIAESLPGCGGQIVLPDGYLRHVYTAVRAAGGLCIADEVQTGFGRVGSRFWGFQLQSVIPDIVTLGKPMGNGHPLAAVVTTAEIANVFANGMEYFNSFGGNPVSCAVGHAVLDVIEGEHLQANAQTTGEFLLQNLLGLRERFDAIGNVRGAGLFIGVELVTDRDTREPATALAGKVVNRMRDEGVLMSTDGPDNNVLKIKPPMVFAEAEARELLDKLASVLNECQ